MKFQAYIFDLDGTIYLGDHLLPDAEETIRHLRSHGAKVLFLSNKPIEDRNAYAKKLTKLGIETDVSEVMNSSFVSALYLSKHYPKAKVYVMGEFSLVEELTMVGLNMTTNPEETDVVLISLDRKLSYEKLHFAYHAIKAGAAVWATNPDLVCPMPDDEIIDAGATIAALEALIGRPIDGVFGKPSEIMVETVLEHLNLAPSECLMIGDRLETDIMMGKKSGMSTALVLSGVAQESDIARLGIRPDHVFSTVRGVLGI